MAWSCRGQRFPPCITWPVDAASPSGFFTTFSPQTFSCSISYLAVFQGAQYVAKPLHTHHYPPTPPISDTHLHLCVAIFSCGPLSRWGFAHRWCSASPSSTLPSWNRSNHGHLSSVSQWLLLHLFSYFFFGLTVVWLWKDQLHWILHRSSFQQQMKQKAWRIIWPWQGRIMFISVH